MTSAQLAPAAHPQNPVLMTPAPFAGSNARASVQLAVATALDSADGTHRMPTRDTPFGCLGHSGDDRDRELAPSSHTTLGGPAK
jgi:hypothetical protein